MKYVITKIYQEGETLVIELDHDYGKDKFRLNISSKKLDPHTDEPKFLSQIKRLLEKKYADKVRKPKEVMNDYVGKEFISEDINVGKSV